MSAALMLAGLLPLGAQAATLGKLSMMSALGQPLNAEIELLAVSEQEKQALVVKLAAQDIFKQANVEFNPVLNTFRFAIESRGTGQVVRLTSTQPLNEPFIDLLLEINVGGASRVVREYSFLLDAPVANNAPAVIAAPSALPKPSAVQASVAPEKKLEAKPKLEAKAEAKPEAKLEAKPEASHKTVAKAKSKATGLKSEYAVKHGDSLTAIANRTRADGVSLDQMLVALYQANPAAFRGENMSRLRSGVVLTVPDAASAGALSHAESNRVVVAQARDFNHYRAQLAARIALAAAKSGNTSMHAASGKVSTRVEEHLTPAGAAKDKLKLSKAGGSDVAGGMRTEDQIAAAKAAADAQSRIQELEKNINDLQKLLELKNQSLAALSAQASVAKPGFFDGWRENPMLLPGGGVLAALLLAWGLYRARRKAKANKASAPVAATPGLTIPVVAPVAVVAAATAATVAAEPARAAAAAVPSAAALDMDKLGFDLELDDDVPPPKLEPKLEPKHDLAAAAQQAPDVDTGVVAPSVVAPLPTAASGLSADVTALNLDLGDAPDADAVPVVTDAVTGDVADALDDDETSAFSKEINTKLDLAAAYQEIGDKEGARELLDEVVKAGNRRQIASARDILAQLQ